MSSIMLLILGVLSVTLGRVHTSVGLDDEGEGEESEEEDIEFLEAREDCAEALSLLNSRSISLRFL